MPGPNAVNSPVNTVPAVGGVTRISIPNADTTSYTVEEEVNIYQDTQANKSWARISQQIPPSCRIQWDELKNQTDVPVSGTDTTNTANGYAIVISTATQPFTATGTVTGTTGFGFYLTGTSSNTYRRGLSDNGTYAVNTATTPANAFLVPGAPTATSVGVFFIGATGTQTITSGYKFGTGTATNTNTYKVRLRLQCASYRSLAITGS